jgi:hypothetical protein
MAKATRIARHDELRLANAAEAAPTIVDFCSN